MMFDEDLMTKYIGEDMGTNEILEIEPVYLMNLMILHYY